MKIYRPPAPVPTFENSLFLAGAITGAAPWKPDLLRALESTNLTILSPDRADYGALSWDDLREQIRWEHDGLRNASAVSFWFPPGAAGAISLYELGSWSHWRGAKGEPKKLFVGAHPDYLNHSNVVLQTELERPDVEVVASLGELAAQILKWQSSLVTA